ncbi:soybean protein regulated by cold-2 [Abeliophyllum distichum]|uniref:Soybean protein regulated by cold-2 n=1 Tax=Abeliophyllum distichum TaxID=126358 RepID=A0ABD1S913_9LAMI
MECRKLDINLVSAKNLPDVRNYGRMKVYAEVSINGISKTAIKTQDDKQNECNPSWNCSIVYTIGERAVQATNIDLVIKLFTKRTFGDRYIGEVKLALKSLFENGVSAQNVSHAVSGTTSGILNISYSFGEKIVVERPSGLYYDNTWDNEDNDNTGDYVPIIIQGVMIVIKVSIILMTGGAFDGGL